MKRFYLVDFDIDRLAADFAMMPQDLKDDDAITEGSVQRKLSSEKAFDLQIIVCNVQAKCFLVECFSAIPIPIQQISDAMKRT